MPRGHRKMRVGISRTLYSARSYHVMRSLDGLFPLSLEFHATLTRDGAVYLRAPPSASHSIPCCLRFVSWKIGFNFCGIFLEMSQNSRKNIVRTINLMFCTLARKHGEASHRCRGVLRATILSPVSPLFCEREKTVVGESDIKSNFQGSGKSFQDYECALKRRQGIHSAFHSVTFSSGSKNAGCEKLNGEWGGAD
jgi:hypothetical protein